MRMRMIIIIIIVHYIMYGIMIFDISGISWNDTFEGSETEKV